MALCITKVIKLLTLLVVKLINHVWAMGIKPTKQQINHFDKALSWFKVNNTEAYMALLD